MKLFSATVTVKSLIVGCCLLVASWPTGPSHVVPSRAGDVAPAVDYGKSLTSLLEVVVDSQGRVDYDLLRGDLSLDFRRILKAIEDYDLPLSNDADRLPFWINAYNVQMLQSVIEHPEVTNVVDNNMSAYFFHTRFRSAGHKLSLDDIEHGILRLDRSEDRFNGLAVSKLDPRIHVGLNCAAVSCPALRREAFTPDRIDAQLDLAMREFANAERHFKVDGDVVLISSLLDWFASDWDAIDNAGDFVLRFMISTRSDYRTLYDYLSGRSADELRQDSRTKYVYDWTLNDQAVD